MDLGAFETSLRAMLAKARTQRYHRSANILAVLRAELEWEAELAHNGRHISVQLIDLGARQVAAAPHAAMNPPIPFRSTSSR